MNRNRIQIFLVHDSSNHWWPEVLKVAQQAWQFTTPISVILPDFSEDKIIKEVDLILNPQLLEYYLTNIIHFVPLFPVNEEILVEYGDY